MVRNCKYSLLQLAEESFIMQSFITLFFPTADIAGAASPKGQIFNYPYADVHKVSL
jgi:hypothetical protein